MIRSSSLAAIAERPHVAKKQEAKAEAQPVNLIICANCKLEKKHSAFGLCNTCYVYQSRHGEPRPLHLARYQAGKQSQPKWCMTCGYPGIFGLCRCQACYMYWLRHKKERPKWLWNEDICCKNCAYPKKAALHRKSGVSVFHKGRCGPCYRYKNRTGNERPGHLWGNGKFGWCLCGRPANYQKDGFDLCTICAEE